MYYNIDVPPRKTLTFSVSKNFIVSCPELYAKSSTPVTVRTLTFACVSFKKAQKNTVQHYTERYSFFTNLSFYKFYVLAVLFYFHHLRKEANNTSRLIGLVM